MIDTIGRAVSKHSSLIRYFVCSVSTAVLEFVLGWLLLHAFPDYLVATNTIAILVSSCVHYFLITRFAFSMRSNSKSAVIYIATFLLGIVLQDLVIWLCYEFIFVSLDELPSYLLSKSFSLGIPFFVLFYLRKRLNEWVVEKNPENALPERRKN